jgi:hypothetical protein
MYKRLFNFAVTTLTILTANLLTSYITDRLISMKWQVKPMRFTIISMAVITVVFYPLFTRLQEWTNSFSKKFMKAGKSMAGKYAGLLLMFTLGMLVLIYFYARMWYNINIVRLILDGKFLSSF